MLPILQGRAGLASRTLGASSWTIVLVAVVCLAAGLLRAAPSQDRDAGGHRAPTVALERGRTIFVLNHCHFCHGEDLTRATMGAANLSVSPLVGGDVDGNAIGAIVRAGLPNLQTAMPSYAELTASEIVDLARYIHYLRQQARHRALATAASAPAGDAALGQRYFAANCRSCHSAAKALTGIARNKYDSATLRTRILRPGPAAPADGVAVSAGQAAHLRLLENYTMENVQDLVAYLSGIR